MDYLDDLEHFSLRWNNYNDTMKTGFHDLLQREDFVDVTIAAEGRLIQAHKMVLSICSPYFKTIFKTNPCQHPVVFLKDVTHREISGILQFMYLGEVSITQEDLPGFLKTAEALQIKGLSSEDVEQAFPPLSPEGNNAIEGEETKNKDEKRIKLLPSNDDNDDRNSTKISPLCNGDDNDKIKTKSLPSHDSHNGDDDDAEDDDDEDEDEDDNDDDNDNDNDDDDNDNDDNDDNDNDDDDVEEVDEMGIHDHEGGEPKKMKMSSADDEMGIHDHEGGEPKKMKMSSADDGLAPIDPHVPVIRTPERPVINSNIQSSQVVEKDMLPQTGNNAPECERASVVQEIDGSGDYQSSDDKEEFAEEIINSLSTGNGSEMAQEVNNLQPVADLNTQGESQQGTTSPTMLKRNQGLCPICGRILQHKKNLQTHILDQHTGIFGCWPCQICHRVCRTWSALRVHTNRHHLNLPPTAVQMSIIGMPQESK